MILSMIARLLCRLTGVACSPDRPSSHDLKHEMRDRGRRVEAHTVELRRQRNAIESALTERPGESHG